MLYSGLNILPRSVFWSAYLNGRSDNLDVIQLIALGEQLILQSREPSTYCDVSGEYLAKKDSDDRNDFTALSN